MGDSVGLFGTELSRSSVTSTNAHGVRPGVWTFHFHAIFPSGLMEKANEASQRWLRHFPSFRRRRFRYLSLSCAGLPSSRPVLLLCWTAISLRVYLHPFEMV